MKRPYNILLTLTLALVGLAACDPVDEANRFTKVDELVPDSGQTEQIERKVLVEEFTGQFCPNCPLGHKMLDNIKTLYGKRVVIVSIHAGDQAFDDPDYGLKTPEGDTYASAYGLDAYPFAVINRDKSTATDIRAAWQGSVAKILQKEAPASIALTAYVDGSNIVVESCLNAGTGTVAGKYQLWVTENNITALQEDAEQGYIADYVHNHVYRASVNGIGGETVTCAEAGTQLTHSIALDSRWDKENLSIVAFIYDKDGVLQAAEAEVEQQKPTSE